MSRPNDQNLPSIPTLLKRVELLTVWTSFSFDKSSSQFASCGLLTELFKTSSIFYFRFVLGSTESNLPITGGLWKHHDFSSSHGRKPASGRRWRRKRRRWRQRVNHVGLKLKTSKRFNQTCTTQNSQRQKEFFVTVTPSTALAPAFSKPQTTWLKPPRPSPNSHSNLDIIKMGTERRTSACRGDSPSAWSRCPGPTPCVMRSQGTWEWKYRTWMQGRGGGCGGWRPTWQSTRGPGPQTLKRKDHIPIPAPQYWVRVELEKPRGCSHQEVIKFAMS